MAQGQYPIPGEGSAAGQEAPCSRGYSYLHSDLLIYALLLLLDLFLELLNGSSIWRCAICLEDLDIPSVTLASGIVALQEARSQLTRLSRV